MLATTYGYWTPPMLSEHGARIDLLNDILHWFMIFLFVAWGIFFVYCLRSFRMRPGHKATYHPVKGTISKYGEVAVALFEAVILVAFSMPVWADYKDEPPQEGADRIDVRVVGEQFIWNFHYPGPDGKWGRTDPALVDTASNPLGLDEDDPAAKDDVYSQELHLPVDKDIYCRLTSKDVIHSFAIPTMRVKQDLIPGMEIPVWFKIKPDALTSKLKDQMTQDFPIGKAKWYKLRHHVSMEDYKDRSGQVLLAKGKGLGLTRDAGDKVIDQLREAGVESLRMQPANPLEVICAQLCGNSHFTMKAQMITHTYDDWKTWLDEQIAEKNEVIEFDDF